jgi:predicted nucleic acid-binding protein
VILVDTSLWVDHLRRGRSDLSRRLEDAEVGCHPFVIGELACGRLHRRDEILGLLAQLPRIGVADHEEVLELVEVQQLAGCGIGWIDAHLLASALAENTPLWTLDRRLEAAARRLRVAA